MKLFRLSWDFLFGVLLICGAPWSIIALTVILFDTYQSVFHVIIPDSLSVVIVSVMFIIAVSIFAYVIRFRWRKRLLPKAFIALEILFGTTLALFLFCFYGVVTYSIIG
jgi:hypothetical protein